MLARPIGVSLVPTLWPRERFDEAWDLQAVWQEVYAEVASDPGFLWEALKRCTGGDAWGDLVCDGVLVDGEPYSDEIVSGLWKVYEGVRDDDDGLGYVQDVELGLCRGDWMLGIDENSDAQQDGHIKPNGERRRLNEKPTLKQVELNTIATAGVSHSNIVSDMHHHLLRTGIYASLSRKPTSNAEAPAASTTHSQRSTSLPTLPTNPTLAPPNTSISGFANALAQAHRLYGPPKSKSTRKTAVLMVVQHDNVNIADERPIEYALWDMGVPCLRCEYREVLERTWFASASVGLRERLQGLESTGEGRYNSGDRGGDNVQYGEGEADEDMKEEIAGRELLFAPFAPHSSHPSHRSTAPGVHGEGYEISVIYLRASLDASELSLGSGLGTRLHLERSRAIKCPSVLGQLAACKRVQQYLSSAEGMQEFVGRGRPYRGKMVRRLSKGVVGMSWLGDPGCELRRLLDQYAPSERTTEELEDVEKVLSKYVLKPIGAEGGGHCVFGSSIPRFYAEHIAPAGSQAAYVLMERIHPPVVRGALISQRGYYLGNLVSELGILGSVLFKPRRYEVPDGRKREAHLKEDVKPIEILSNEAAGWTMKSKSVDVPEMSVIKGYGCFDTPCLADWDTYLEEAREGIKPGSVRDRVGGR